ncbi:MAG: amidase [Acidobacteria bacterium]|nr:amidase [Acidobacteriota bacterium]
MKRREFVSLGAIGAAGLMIGRKASAAAVVEFEETTVAALQQGMGAGRFSSADLVRGYSARIAEIDKKTNSMIEMNPDAPAIAAQMDAERKSGKVRGPLHGIPVVIKDNIDTADRMKTTAGSLALLDAPAPKEDAFIARKLREAGAVILGKTNLSEWANFRSGQSSSGWSGRGGQTRNPYVLDRTPCGSSSGSGAAIAANLAAIAIGTETDGSIVCPASINGIVGIKPTLGLVSRSGIIPIAHSQDTAGPMCRTVADAAAVLSAIVGTDPNDSITSQASKGSKDYTQFLKKDGLKGKKIGVMRQYFGTNPRLDKLMETQLQALKDGGAEVVDIMIPTLEKFGDAEYEVLLYEFKADLNKYLAARGGAHRSLADLIKFNESNAAKEMPYFGQDIMLKAEEKGDLETRAYRLALLQSKVLTQDQGIDAVMDKEKLHAIVAPSNSPPWLIDLVNGDSPTSYVGSSSLAAVSGYPNITVPAGFIAELPIGISFFGRAFSEPLLIEIAYGYEQLTTARRKPKFLATYS